MKIFRFYSKIFTISLIGRPNVGKSTLFNNLAGTRNSLVHNTPGLTRDRIEAVSNLYIALLFGVPIKFIDTAGWDPVDTPNSPQMIQKMMSQTRKALFDSDLALFLLDVRQGVTIADEKLAEYLKKEGIQTYPNLKEVILVGNKAEQSFLDDISNEVYKLNFGDPVLISAEHNERIVDLYDRIKESIPDAYIEESTKKYEKRLETHKKIKDQKLKEIKELEKKSGEDWNLKEWERTYDQINPPENSDYDSDSEINIQEILSDPQAFKNNPEIVKKTKPLQLSIIGRPNVGKSSLINSILGEERVITDSEAGTTRDSVYIDYAYNGKKFRLVDTAGLTKHSRGTLTKMIHDDVKKAIKYSHVVILLFDASEGVLPIELDLAREAIQEGRVLITVGNKWDKIPSENKTKLANYYSQVFYKKITLKGLNLVVTSASTKYNIRKLLNEVLELYEKWNTRISTGVLNRWLESFKKVQNMPTEAGELLKIKYVAQIKSRPPTFYMFVNDRSLMKENYMKNFISSLSKEFGLGGVPVRVIMRDKHLKAKNVHKPQFKLRKAKDLFKNSSQKTSKSKKPIIVS